MDERRHEPIDPRTDPAAARVVAAVRAVDAPAPPQLRAAVEAAVAEARQPPRRRRVRRPAFAVAAAGGLAVLVAVVLAITLGGSGTSASTPSVAQAARVALAHPTAAAPAPVGGGDLAAQVEGVAFPDWSHAAPYRLRATGQRLDDVHGRSVRTVVYADERGGRIGYAIVAGTALPWGDGQLLERHGVRVWRYDVGGVPVVAWLRDGRTCVLAGRGVDAHDLVELATVRDA